MMNMTQKIIRQSKIKTFGGSLYVLVPKDIRDDANVTEDSMYNLSYDSSSKSISIKFFKKPK